MYCWAPHTASEVDGPGDGKEVYETDLRQYISAEQQQIKDRMLVSGRSNEASCEYSIRK